MKVKAMIVWDYEVDDSNLQEYYGTEDKQKCVEIDLSTFNSLMWEEFIPENAELKLLLAD